MWSPKKKLRECHGYPARYVTIFTVQFALESVSSLLWNQCPVCRGITVQFALEYASGQPIKFEIVLEGRIELELSNPSDVICGVSTLTKLDMATSKLLANSDRWGDDSVFNRDVIDLAMIPLSLPILRRAVAKAETAYGKSILRDLDLAIERLESRQNWLEHCIDVLSIQATKAVLWTKIRTLKKVLK